MKRKYTRFNNPPFFLSDSEQELPEKLLKKINHKINVSHNLKFVVWVKAFSGKTLWGNTPFLFVTNSKIIGFDFHDFDGIKLEDVREIKYTNKQIILILKSEINNRKTVSLIGEFKPNKKLITEIGLRLTGLLSEFNQKNLPTNQPENSDSSKIDTPIEDSFRNASFTMKLYTVLFWFLFGTYVIGGITLKTWNPRTMYNKLMYSGSSVSSKKNNSINQDEKTKKNNSEKSNLDVISPIIGEKFIGYQYTITWVRHTRCDDSGGSGSPKCTLILEKEKMIRVDQETLRQLAMNNCPDEFWKGACHEGFRINTWGKKVFKKH